MERLKHQPGIGPVIHVIETWPRITAWIVLSVGCVALLVYEARDVGLSTGNWIALVVATIAVAGLCILIVSWEDDDAEEMAAPESRPDSAPTAESGSSATPPDA